MKFLRMILQSGPGFPKRQARNFIHFAHILSLRVDESGSTKALPEFFYDHAGIMATKAKGITECCPNQAFLRFPESEIQPWIKVRIVDEMINGGRNNIILHTHDAR